MTWGMVAVAGASLVGSMMSSGGSGGGSSGSSSQTQAYDPYSQYRPAAATKLNALMNDPSTITTLPEYQADMQAAGRTSAAQGYTGSGNALVAAANAGGQAYQQAFNNLSTLAGAGQSPAAAQSAANQQANYQQGQSNQTWGQVGNIAGQVVNGFGNMGNPGYTNGSAIQPIPTTNAITSPTISADDF